MKLSLALTTLLFSLALAAPANDATASPKEGTVMDAPSDSDGVEAQAHSNAQAAGGDLRYPICPPGTGYCDNNGRCCGRHSYCCPFGCCPDGYPICGRDGRCYRDPE